jgi:hypothetical protein
MACDRPWILENKTPVQLSQKRALARLFSGICLSPLHVKWFGARKLNFKSAQGAFYRTPAVSAGGAAGNAYPGVSKC